MTKKEEMKQRNAGGTEQTQRLSETEFLIMSLLVDSDPKGTYGLQLIEKSNGKLKKGTVYVLLGRLEDKAFVEGRFEVEGSAVPRKLYKATGHGRKVYEAWRNVMELGGMRGAFAT